MKAYLTNQSFQDIRIKDTSLIGGNFARCKFIGPEIENVDISGINLNGSLLLNFKWKNIKIHGINQLKGLTNDFRSVCFSPDCSTLVSGSQDNSIRLWDAKSGKSFEPVDKLYKDLLAQFETLSFQINPFQTNQNYATIIISKEPTLYAQGALILIREFLNHQGYDFQFLIQSQGGQFLEK